MLQVRSGDFYEQIALDAERMTQFVDMFEQAPADRDLILTMVDRRMRRVPAEIVPELKRVMALYRGAR